MSQPNMFCRLCINICNSYNSNSLFDANGHRTEVFSKTAKYFSTTLLDLNESKHLGVICTVCWGHISNFHDFQESVWLAQQNLTNKQTDLVTISEAKLNAADSIQKQDTLFLISEVTDGLSWNSIDNVSQKSNSDKAICEQELTPNIYSNNNAAHTSMAVHQDSSNIEIKQEEEILTISNKHTGLLVKEEEDFNNPTNSSMIVHLNTSSIRIKQEEEVLNFSSEHVNLVVKQHENSEEESISVKEEEETSIISNEHDSLFIKEERYTEGECEDDEDDNSMNISEESDAYDANSNYGEESSDVLTKKPQLRTLYDYDCFIAKWKPTLECVVCSIKQSSFSLLLQHFQHHHSNEICHIICCEQKLVDCEAIAKHIIYHNEKDDLKCDKCLKTFSTKTKRNRHMIKVHSGKREPEKCPKCENYFGVYFSLKRHMESYCFSKKKNKHFKEDVPLPFDCKICGKTFSCKMNLRYHLNHTHSKHKERLKCKVCNKGFRYEWMLDDHMATHTGNGIVCPHCTKTFKYRTSVYRHVKREHPNVVENTNKQEEKKRGNESNSVHTSNEYKDVTLDSNSTKNATKIAKSVTAEKEYYEVAKESDSLNNHQSTYDTDSSSDELSESETTRPQLLTTEDYDKFIAKWKPKLSCTLCSEIFTNFSLLLQHFQMQHHGEICHVKCCEQKLVDRDAIAKHIIYHNEKKDLKCDTCFATFATKASRKVHMDNVHSEKHELKECPKCGNYFGIHFSLTRHMKSFCYSEKKDPLFKEDTPLPFACDICGKTFSDRGSLIYHVNCTHSELKEQFKCGICNKGFRYQSLLDEHVARHEGKVTSCQYCDKTFKHHSSIYRHMRREHPKELETKHILKKNKKDNVCNR